MTPSSTTPLAITACTVEIGASPSAAMCSTPPKLATSTPAANQREAKRARRLCHGRWWRIGTLERAPRDFISQPRLVAAAAIQAIAKPIATEAVTTRAPV